jgi:hypothetical protein
MNEKNESQTFNYDAIVKSPENVIPVQAGIHIYLKTLDSRLRGNDRLENATF